MHLNINSIRNKLTLLETFLIIEKPDIVIITEHWLLKEEMFTLTISNYVICNYFCRDETGYGGVLILAVPSLIFSKINTPAAISSVFECCAVNFKLKNINLRIFGLYRAPNNANIDDFFIILDDTLKNTVDKRRKFQSPIVLCGDLNIDILTNNNLCNRLFDTISSYNMNVLNSNPTRVTNHSSTCIDVFLSNIDVSHYKTSTVSSGISDHLGIILSLNNIHKPKQVIHKQYTRCFREDAIKEFNDALSREQWESIYLAGTLDFKFQNFMQIFNRHFNSFFPKKLLHRRVNTRPPLPDDLIREGQYLRDFHRELMKINSPLAKLQYKSKLATHKSKIEEFEKSSNASSLKTSKNPSKTAWNIIKSRSSSLVSPSTSKFTIIRNGAEISSPKLVANTLNKEFNLFSIGEKPKVIWSL